MKWFNRLTALIVIGVCITTTAPIVAALALARNQALKREETYIKGFAKAALARTEMTGDQLVAGAARINGLSSSRVCSAKGLDLMREIDLESTLLQSVGRIDGNFMRCSSFGGTRAFDLGPPDLTSRSGTVFRTHVRLLDPNVSYLAVSKGGFVGIVHKDLALSFVDGTPGLKLSVFSWSTGKPLFARGQMAPIRFDAQRSEDKVSREGDQLVAVVRSKRYDLGAVATLPIAATAVYTREAAMLLIPLGVLTGIMLSALLVHFIRIRSSMPAMIRHALKANEFHLVYQPVVNLASGKTIGAEALIRWRRGHGDLIPPDVFIAVAEQAGLISLITERVLDLLAQDAGHVVRVAPNFHFAVNFAAADMHRTDILEKVRRFVLQSGITVDNLVIEATERSFVDVELARRTLRQLRAAGIKVAIDDFGTGYSSLGYLAQIEIDYLKIDKLFVHSLGTDSATSHVAGRIIEMAKDLNLEIIAEGIETSEQEALLKGFKVDYAQGYLFARPMPLEDLLQRLRAERPPALVPRKRDAA